VKTHNRLRYCVTKKILITGYVQVRTYDVRYKMCNNEKFFHYLCSALMEKLDFYCLCSALMEKQDLNFSAIP
jgi:hypothetical protein